MQRFSDPMEAFNFVLNNACGPVSVLIDYPGTGAFQRNSMKGRYVASWGGVRDQRYIHGRLQNCGFDRVGSL